MVHRSGYYHEHNRFDCTQSQANAASRIREIETIDMPSRLYSGTAREPPPLHEFETAAVADVCAALDPRYGEVPLDAKAKGIRTRYPNTCTKSNWPKNA